MKNQTELNTIWESLGISNDFMFGKIMQDAELCKELLQRILPDLEIDHIEYPEAQKSIRLDVDAKSVRLDVYVRDGKGSIYDIDYSDFRFIPINLSKDHFHETSIQVCRNNYSNNLAQAGR